MPMTVTRQRAVPHERRVWRIPRDIVASQPKRREIHVIADNLSTRKTLRHGDRFGAHQRMSLAVLWAVARRSTTIRRFDQSCSRAAAFAHELKRRYRRRSAGSLAERNAVRST